MSTLITGEALSTTIGTVDYDPYFNPDPNDISHLDFPTPRSEAEYIARREQTIAGMAGLSVADLVELNFEHQRSFEVSDFVLPSLIRGREVRVYRGGFNFESSVPIAPRGGSRLYQERVNVRPELETEHLSTGMDMKLMLILQELVNAGVVTPTEEIPVGGKTEIVTPIDPRLYTPDEKKLIIVETGKGLSERGFFTEKNHRTGPDVNMKPGDMDDLRDALIESGISERDASMWITGKTDGVAGRPEATARGAAKCLDRYMEREGIPEGTVVRFSLQGFGNAGSPLVDQFNKISNNYKGSLVCVSDETGTVHCPEGIKTDVFKKLLVEKDPEGNTHYIGVHRAAQKYKSLYPEQFIVLKSIGEDKDYWLKVPADCFVPAAMAAGINEKNVHYITGMTHWMGKNISDKFCPIVLPLANDGVRGLAQIRLERFGVRTFHFTHANAYGVVASMVESLVAAGMITEKAKKDPKYVNQVINTIAERVTDNLYDSSVPTTGTGPASMAMAAEARRYQELAKRYGRPNYAKA